MPAMGIPDDFPARMRAGRAYADLSREELAERLGMSAGYVKNVENGKGLRDMEARALLDALPEITHLPRSFFTGEERNDALAEIRELLFDAHEEREAATAGQLARFSAVLTRLDELQAAIQARAPDRRRTA